MVNNFKVLIVDDHKIFREGLVFMISKMSGFEVVGEASNGNELLQMVDNIEVDIVIMDISMPEVDGITATTKLLEKKPGIRVIALTMFTDEEYYVKMIQAGVCGYILKESGKDELATALTKVASGENYFSQKILQNIILNMNSAFSPARQSDTLNFKLTRRETEILTLICKGYTNPEISEKLFLSQRTIEGHKSNLFSKTGVKNSINLVMYAMKNKLVEI